MKHQNTYTPYTGTTLTTKLQKLLKSKGGLNSGVSELFQAFKIKVNACVSLQPQKFIYNFTHLYIKFCFS